MGIDGFKLEDIKLEDDLKINNLLCSGVFRVKIGLNGLSLEPKIQTAKLCAQARLASQGALNWIGALTAKDNSALSHEGHAYTSHHTGFQREIWLNF